MLCTVSFRCVCVSPVLLLCLWLCRFVVGVLLWVVASVRCFVVRCCYVLAALCVVVGCGVNDVSNNWTHPREPSSLCLCCMLRLVCVYVFDLF